MGLDDAAQKRKERLAALKQRAAAAAETADEAAHPTATKRSATDASTLTDGADDSNTDAGVAATTGVRFRSYQPLSEELQDLTEAPHPIGPDAKEHIDTAEGKAEQIRQQALEEVAKRSKELDLASLAPRKPNWDLKRDLAKRLEKLDRKTDIVIADLIRERLRQEKDLALAADAAEMDHRLTTHSRKGNADDRDANGEPNATSLDDDDD